MKIVMKKYWKHISMFHVLLLGIFLSGCSEEEGDTELPPPTTKNTELCLMAVAGENVPGWFENATMGVFVRAAGNALADTAFSNVENRGFWMPDIQSGILNPIDNHPLFYPAEGEVDVVAYYPYTETLDKEGYAISLADQVTLSERPVLYAQQQGMAPKEEPLKMEFNHVLCKISLQVTAEDAISKKQLEALEADKVIFANLPLMAHLSLQNGTLLPGKEKGNVSPLKSLVTDGEADAVFSAILFPQEAEQGLKRTISFTMGGAVHSVEIPDTTVWKAGMHYIYPLSVSVEGIKFGTAEFRSWGMVSHDDLTGQTGEAWFPGMNFMPYPGMPENALHERVYVIVGDADSHGAKIMEVLNNRAWGWKIHDMDKANWKECFFPTHSDIDLYLTETYDDPNPEYRPCDIFSSSTSGDNLERSRINFKKMLDKERFPEFPLVITSAGNGTNTFTQEAWDFCLEYGSLNWDDIVEIKGWEPDENGQWSPEQAAWYKPGDVSAAYVIQDPDNLGHAKDYIVVGRDDGHGNKPGPILKDRWICTYYSFGIFDSKTDGTSFSTPYVAKIAAEIKRRAPHYTNDEIAQLIFSTADDLGEPGCDEVYGWGRMNPANIWKELTRRGY